MRLGRLMVVTTMMYILAVCGFLPAARTQGVLPVIVAQTAEPTLMIRDWEQNPSGLVEVIDSVQDLLALQVLLTTEAQEVRVDTVTIGFGNRPVDRSLGNESFLDTMRVRLIEDQNANGSRDDGERLLGTQEVGGFEDPITVTFALAPAVIIPPSSDTALMVIVDINSSETQSALPLRPGVRLTYGAWSLLLLPLFGLAAYWPQTRHTRRRYLVILLLVMCCSLVLSSCSGDGGDDDFIFVVNLPSNGLSGQGLLLGPENAIDGATIRLTEG